MNTHSASPLATKLTLQFFAGLFILFIAAISNLAHATNLLAGFTSIPGHFPPSDAYIVNDDVVVTSFDGTEITANVLVPTSGEASYPAIIFINSWAMDEYEYIPQAARFAEQGYVVLSYATRGFGESTGKIGTAGPNDMVDFSRMIDWLLEHTPTDINRIGASGISYGSGISLLGAAHDNRVSAVVAMSTWGDLEASLYGQETPRLIWGGLLTLLGQLTGNPEEDIAENYGNLIKHQNIEETLEWAGVRSPRTYIDALNARNVPIYIANNFGDNLFQPNQALNFYEQLTTPKRLDLSQGMHASAELWGLINANKDHYLWTKTEMWFDRWLKGEANGIEFESAFNVEPKNQKDHYENLGQWPSPLISDQRLYLHSRGLLSNGKLKTSQYRPWWTQTDTILSGLDTLATTGIPMISNLVGAEITAPVITSIPLISRVNGIVFETNRLDDTMQLRGIPKLRLNIEPSKSKYQMVAYLYDVDAVGIGRLITHGPITDYQANEDQTQTVDLELVATAYDVPAGHKVALVIDTFDLLYAPPTLSIYSLKFRFNKNNQSWLDLPIKE
ncbi:CocE/NonD family hydrolase [Litoribacillus peritrichatus]|uniref:CocE/NonD family hydrolase n=1 Tax=Litoribacillus peritrichatus TaxID=718191 RepID=A0ABP7MMF4_9GAMM